MEHDFIVVGVGSAGAVLLNRLSEDPATRVLGIEAGGAEVPANVTDAAVWFRLFGSEVDWGYKSVPQAALDGRVTYEPRGKMPGGTSNLHLMMHVRGHPSDYDNWAYNGCPGWAYQEVLPYFQKLEDQEDDTSPWAGKGGPLPVKNASLHGPNPTSSVFIESCRELGYPYTEDFNGPQMEGVGWHHLNVVAGERFSCLRAYYEPAVRRPNVSISLNSHATRLLFSGRKCIGVEYIRDGQLHSSLASQEVIVSCGALESPKLLLLSGIGDPSQLREFDIPVVAALPGVGENFHNHVLTGLICEMSQSVPQGRQNLSEAALFWKSEPGWLGPDLQFAFVHVPFNIIVGQAHPNSVSILPGVVRPMSRGWLRLASRNPLDPPLPNPNYLSDAADARRLVQCLRLSREIFAAQAFSRWAKAELMPGPEYRTDDELMAFARRSADSYHHQAGSCKMGVDDMAVVDPRLRVHGVEGLRVCDASAMPTVPSGNCYVGIVMMAEKLSDLIRKDLRLGRAPA